ncbi:hypothetical protein [secondary endosymbiont of Heteropsylla cubana]|nr:hypothetical protein [secondary endosymbiont of Heteropsylla cubana]
MPPPSFIYTHSVFQIIDDASVTMIPSNRLPNFQFYQQSMW